MQIEVAPQEVTKQKKRILLHFPSGILGFQDVKDYILFDDEASPLKCLQAVDEPELAFVITEPTLFMTDYRIKIEDPELHELQVEDPDHLVAFVLITVPCDDSDVMTANLQGPLIVNTENNLAKQLVLSDKRYHTRHPLCSTLSNF